jgi:hypothetical protein
MRTKAITFLAIVNGAALVITILFWGAVFFGRLVPLPPDLSDMASRANAATTYGFLVGDVVWSVPLLLLSTIGLWHLRPWGWTACQMANILWLYSMTVIWMRDAYTTVSPGSLLFLPFAIIAAWAIIYLWRKRLLFWEESGGKQKE